MNIRVPTNFPPGIRICIAIVEKKRESALTIVCVQIHPGLYQTNEAPVPYTKELMNTIEIFPISN